MRHLDSEVLVRGVASSVMVDVSDHRSTDRDAEDIIGISKEAHAGDKARLDVEPLG